MDAMTTARDIWPAGTKVRRVDSRRAMVFFPEGEPATRAVAAGFLPASRAGARALRTARMLQAWLGWAPSAVSSGGDLCDYLEELEASTPAGRRESVRIGRGPAAHSLVVRHRDAGGAASSFTRVVFGQAGAAAVTREAHILEVCSVSHAPVLLGARADGTQGFSAITTGALSGRPYTLHAPCPEDLEDCFPVSATFSVESHPWLVAYSEELGGPLFHKAVDLLASARAWPVCVMHGDAAPWNAFMTSEGSTQLIDWEYGEAEGLWLFDRAFWVAQTARLVDRCTPQTAAGLAIDCMVGRYPDVLRREAAGVAALMALSVSARMARGGTEADVAWWSRCAAECVSLGERGLVL